MSTSILSTRERYSPIARASEKAEAARKAYNEAGKSYLADPTLQNSNALASARKALTEAEQLLVQAATIWKHTEGKKRPAAYLLTQRRTQIEDALQDPFIGKERASALLEELAEIDTALSRE